MPRPNPEYWQTDCPWTSNYAGSKSTLCRSYLRTYTSQNSPGYPTSLRFNPHTVELKEQWLDKNAFWRRYRTSNPAMDDSWARGPMDGSSRGISGTYREIFAGDTNLKNRVRTKLAGAVKRNKVNLAVSLAEAGQSYRLFTSSARRIASAYRMLRTGDIRGLRRVINVGPNHERSLLRRGPMDIRRHAPELWLELQYGWKPLLSDLYTSVTQMHSRVIEGFPIRAKSTGTEVRKRSLSNVNTVGIVRADVVQVQQTRVLCLVDYWVDSTLSANLNDWGLTNPLEVIWELVPYSFVVDWFLPVGDYLSSFDAYLGVTFKQGLESTTMEMQSKAVYEPQPETNANYTRVVYGTDRFKHFKFTRNTLTSFPRAGLPSIKNPFSKTHVANAMSLLSLAFDRKLHVR